MFNFNQTMHVALDKLDLMEKTTGIFKSFPFVSDPVLNT